MEPENCKKEYCGACLDCEYITIERVNHPAGESTNSIEKLNCDLDYWKDDF